MNIKYCNNSYVVSGTFYFKFQHLKYCSFQINSSYYNPHFTHLVLLLILIIWNSIFVYVNKCYRFKLIVRKRHDVLKIIKYTS